MVKKVMLCLVLAAFCCSGQVMAADRLNLNSATVEEMAASPAIGPDLARKIAEHRENVGDFASVEELKDVDGIDDAKAREIEKSFDIKGVASSDCNC